MKILILTNNFSGLHSFRKEVVKALRDVGHEVTISAPFDSKREFFGEIGCSMIDTRFNRKGTNPIKDFSLVLNYCKLLKKTNPNVVLSYTIKPNLLGGIACQLYGVPQIANITGLGTAVENSGWLRKITIPLYRLGLRKANTVFFQNKANMVFCQDHKMVKGRQILIPGSGVNLQYHSYQDYPSREEPLRFIFISRLLREKGIEEYLFAAKAIKSKYPNTEFHILGECEDDYAGVIDQLQKDNYIVYHGNQLDVRPYIGQSCCTIHPSFYPEGMSNVLLESCAAGRPIITTDRPGCREIIENGVNGFVVKQQDKSDLVEIIERFINLPYEDKKRMGISARHKVEREFDRQIVVDAYLNEIAQIESKKYAI